MAFPGSENWWTSLLRCPDCGAALAVRDQAHHCLDGCGWHGKDWRDLLCQNPRPCSLIHRRKPSREPENWLQELITEPPERSYNGPAAQRDST